MTRNSFFCFTVAGLDRGNMTSLARLLVYVMSKNWFCYSNTVVALLAGWNAHSRARTSAFSSTLCARQAHRTPLLRLRTDQPPLGGAREAVQWTESATAAGHLSEITQAKETALIINIRGTAVITEIRGGIETEKESVTGTKTTESGNMGGTRAVEPKTE